MKLAAAIVILGSLAATSVSAQPYQFDQNEPAPSQVVLFDDPENEGVKLGSSVGMLKDRAQRLFVNGLIEYQPVDLFIAPVGSGGAISVDLVKATWDDVVESCTSEGGKVCRFSIRTLGDVGISISGDNGTEYALLAVVGAEIRPQLETPFYEISSDDLEALESTASGEADAQTASSESGMTMYLLVAVVILLLVIVAFLLGKKSRQGSAVVLALVLPFLLTGISQAQEELSDAMREQIRQEVARGVSAEMTRFSNAQERIESVTDVAEQVNELRKLKKTFDKFWSSYNGLGDCVNSGPSWSGEERIPSFCEDQEGCDECFLAAREQFNLARYYLTRLKTIHSCTIKMTDSAKAFGDSFSSATKSGLGWYDARLKIEESVTNLNKAYDAKYAELMGDLGNSMAEMSICEAQYGLEDWYDRFGFVYYEFMKDKYKRE